MKWKYISQMSKCSAVQFSAVQLHLERWHLPDSALYSSEWPTQTSREREMQAVSGLTDATIPLLGKTHFSKAQLFEAFGETHS